MEKFTVYLQQYVERVATVQVEAKDAAEARAIAEANWYHAEWKDGDDALDVDTYAVHDASGDVIWER